MRTREKLRCFSLVFYVRMSGTMGNQRCVMLGVTCRVKCRNTSCYRSSLSSVFQVFLGWMQLLVYGMERYRMTKSAKGSLRGWNWVRGSVTGGRKVKLLVMVLRRVNLVMAWRRLGMRLGGYYWSTVVGLIA